MAGTAAPVRNDGVAGKAVTVLDIRASSFDAATGVVTGITAVRLDPVGDRTADPFDWRLPEGLAGGSEEEENRRQLDAFDSVRPELGAYMAESLAVAHGAAWTRTFLRKATLAAGAEWDLPAILCTRRLARFCFPGLDSYGLPTLVDALALAPERPAGGAERCIAVAELYRRCVAHLGRSGSRGHADIAPFMAGPGGAAGRRDGRG